MSARGLVVGASGQVGGQMLRELTAARGAGYALPTSRDVSGRPGWLQLDLAELSSEQAGRTLENVELEAIFCVGGMTDVERCEDEPELAEAANARGPAVLAGYARRRGIPFCFYSTEYVFDGSVERPGPYAEDAVAHALSVYGRSKLAGERAVLEQNAEALVARTTVVYGQDDREKNYVYSLVRNLGLGRRMRVPADQISTPTYNRDLVRSTLGLLAAGTSGVWHLCGPELLSRIAFAEMVAESMGLDAGLLDPLPTSQLGQRAPRPLHAGLATGKLLRVHPELRIRTVREALAECGDALRTFLKASVEAAETVAR